MQTEPTKEMTLNFFRRTMDHVERVAKNLMVLKGNFNIQDFDFWERAHEHDASKYQPKELDAYIWLTEMHRCKNCGIPFEYPEGIEDKVRKSTYHHIRSNRHHPEYHDVPSDMTDIDIVEMVCDWTAMAQELKQDNGSAMSWAMKNIDERWRFDGYQRELIYDAINILDKELKQGAHYVSPEKKNKR